MSASELAPFVAAIIDVGITPELQRKNKEQKRKIDALEFTIQDRDNERLLVQITGRYGHPIYLEKSLKEGRAYRDERDHDCDSLWVLDVSDEEFNCPLDEESITQLEIRVGGMLIMPRVLEQLVRMEFYEQHDEDEDDLDKLVYLDKVNFLLAADLDYDNSPVSELTGWVEPITVRHYKALVNLQRSGTEILTKHLFEHNVLPTTEAARTQPTRKMTLTVQKIEFPKNTISGCISLMEQLGINTSWRPLYK